MAHCLQYKRVNTNLTEGWKMKENVKIVKFRRAQYLQGLITQKELYKMLDDIGIRGALKKDTHKYIGYDYINQEWIEC